MVCVGGCTSILTDGEWHMYIFYDIYFQLKKLANQVFFLYHKMSYIIFFKSFLFSVSVQVLFHNIKYRIYSSDFNIFFCCELFSQNHFVFELNYCTISPYLPSQKIRVVPKNKRFKITESECFHNASYTVFQIAISRLSLKCFGSKYGI